VSLDYPRNDTYELIRHGITGTLCKDEVTSLAAAIEAAQGIDVQVCVETAAAGTASKRR